MPPFTYHVLICGGSSCAERDATAVRDAFRKELDTAGIRDRVRETKVSCLQNCAHGPNMVVYPDGVWYKALRPTDAAQIARSHIGEGRPVERLVYDWNAPA